MLSVISQPIQSFVPIEWQLLDHFRCGRNESQPGMQNSPAEMQRMERGIAFVTARLSSSSVGDAEPGDACCPMPAGSAENRLGHMKCREMSPAFPVDLSMRQKGVWRCSQLKFHLVLVPCISCWLPLSLQRLLAKGNIGRKAIAEIEVD